jgi:hypothetical protein
MAEASGQGRGSLRFGGFELDVRSGELRKDGVHVGLRMLGTDRRDKTVRIRVRTASP